MQVKWTSTNRTRIKKNKKNSHQLQRKRKKLDYELQSRVVSSQMDITPDDASDENSYNSLVHVSFDDQ